MEWFTIFGQKPLATPSFKMIEFIEIWQVKILKLVILFVIRRIIQR